MIHSSSTNPKVIISQDRTLMGEAAAELVHRTIKKLVTQNGSARIVMACAPSQDDFYVALVSLARAEPSIWKKVTVFHMDEYVGLHAEQPQSFRSYLKHAFLDHVDLAVFHPIRGEVEDLNAEAGRYSALIESAPIDLISMGIGENGHIAFNDPPIADFNDSVSVKKVELDSICRQQQVNDGCFPSLDDVPTHALSLTLPVFARASMLVCIVPNIRKAEAVRNTLQATVGPHCPATLLRQHANSYLFLDRDSASLL